MCLGIESTAHTFGVGIVKDKKILANVKDSYITKEGGIVPAKAAEHHVKVCDKIMKDALKKAKVKLKKEMPEPIKEALSKKLLSLIGLKKIDFGL